MDEHIEYINEKAECYQEKMIEAALNTITIKLGELSDNKEMKMRRWIWELIQNATDCAREQGVTIQFETNKDTLVFSHDGNIFTYKNLLDLITQISSKRNDNDNKIGKFGTGFISTHLISEIVEIKSIYHRKKDDTIYKNLELLLDRSGKTDESIKNSILQSIDNLNSLDTSQNIDWYQENNEFATSFIYNLSNNDSEDVQKVIKHGEIDLDKAISFVFAFSTKIRKVNFNDNSYSCSRSKTKISKNISIIEIKKTSLSTEKEYDKKKVLVCEDEENEVSIAMLVEDTSITDTYRFLPMQDFTKLYYTFPLIGTENFSFPVTLHSPKFKVLMERNNINEGNSDNYDIIKIAIKLYKEVLEFANQNNWGNLYNLCYVSESNGSSLQEKISKEIQKIYKTLPIVNIQKNEESISKQNLCTHLDNKFKNNILIPYMDTDEYSDKLWELLDQIERMTIPRKEEYNYWLQVSPECKCTLTHVYNHFLKGKEMSTFDTFFDNINSAILWLNKFYSLWIQSSNKQEFLSKGIVLNQNDTFLDISILKFDNNIDEELKDILSFFKPDLKSKLVHKGIVTLNDINIESVSNEDVSSEISNYIRKQFSDESNAKPRLGDMQETFNRLSDWFFKNPEIAKTLFQDIFEKKHQLSSHEETIRRLELATNIESSMKQNHLDMEQLAIVIKESGRLLELFGDNEIVLTEDLKKLFEHISSKSLYSRQKLEELIERSIKNVHNYLWNNDYYEVPELLEDWSKKQYSDTVFPAYNKKDEREVFIVIRPSDNQKIIFYADAELEALDNNACELWTDDGKRNIRAITLGDLIKTTGMTTIPLKNIFNAN